MYDIKTIEKTLDLLDRYDGQFAKTARETGIKVGTIRSWFNKRRNGVPLLAKRRKKHGKWSEGQRKAAKGSPRKTIDEETKKKAVADLAARR